MTEYKINNMSATWRNFESYLKKNILYLTTSSGQSKQGQLALLDEAKKKYDLEECVDDCSELIKVLNNLLLSIKETYTNNYENIYKLPELTYLSEGQKILLKKWEELFPRRTEVRFGNRNDDSSDSEISSKVWGILKQIYKDWAQTKLHPVGLEKEADDIIMLVLETASKEKYSRIVKKHPNLKKRMEKWLDDYEKLTTTQKEELKEDKKLIKKDYEIISSLDGSGNNSKIQSFWEKVKDVKNWSWGTIGISATVVVFVLFLYWAIKKMLGLSKG